MEKMRRALGLVLMALAVVVIAYAIGGPAAFPQPFVTHYKEQAAAAAIPLDRSVVFHYGEPIAVAHEVDGDTIELINGEYVRFNGIDTPEEVDPRKPVQCYAAEAAAETARLVPVGTMITVEQDVSYKDKYGRWVGIVHLPDGTSVNLTLVKEGYAFAYKYKPDITYADEFKSAEAAAKSADLGLWSHCTVHKTKSGREQTNDLLPST